MSKLGTLPALALIGLLAALTFREEGPAVWTRPRPAPPPSPLESAAVMVLALLPLAVSLAGTWGGEQAFTGDNGYHVNQHLVLTAYWRALWPRFALLALAVWAAARWGLLRAALPAAAGVLWFWSRGLVVDFGMLRYPGAGYFFALPFHAAASVLDLSAFQQVRLWSALAAPLWLLVLRPFFVGRRPELRVLPACLLLFWQKDAVYLFSSIYLEPLAVVLCLTAAEIVLDRPREEALGACLLVGLAAVVKEQAMLLLPFVWLAGEPWTLDAAGRRRAAMAGLVAAAPFAFYFLFRSYGGGFRFVGVATFVSVADPVRLSELGRRLVFGFGWPGLAALALGVAVLARRARFAAACLLAAAGFQAVFFYADSHSEAWTGYPRFHLLPLALIAAGLIPPAGALLAGRRRAAFWGGTAALALLNGVVLLPELRRIFAQPAPYRSFTLHYDDPEYFAIASAVDKAEARGALKGVRELVLADTTGGDFSVDSWLRAYPALKRRFALGTLVTDPPGLPAACVCDRPDRAVIAPFLPDVNLRALLPHFPAETRERDGFRTACMESLRRSCAVLVEDRHGEDLLAVVGSGVRLQEALARRPSVSR